MAYAQAKSASVNAWVQEITHGGSGIDVSSIFKGTGGLAVEIDGQVKKLGDSGAKTVNSSQTLKKLDKIEAGGQKVNYNRKDWNHWVSKGNSCWNVREDVLATEAAVGSIVYLDDNKQTTGNKSSACSIKSGKWVDPYTGKTVTDPSALDIDHMIPLSYAAQHGGQAWDAKRKESYANSTKKAYHLVAVDAGANRSKGDKGPSQWMPANKAYHCEYAKAWVDTADDWDLTLAQADITTLNGILQKCGK